MNLNEYQEQAYALAIYPPEFKIAYPTLGLNEEIGELLATEADDVDAVIKEMGDVVWYCGAVAEDLDADLEFCFSKPKMSGVTDVLALYQNGHRIAGRVKKIIRGDDNRDAKVREVCGYIGDILLRIEALAGKHGVSLEEVCERNLTKLRDRKDRGVLQGDGDTR